MSKGVTFSPATLRGVKKSLTRDMAGFLIDLKPSLTKFGHLDSVLKSLRWLLGFQSLQLGKHSSRQIAGHIQPAAIPRLAY